MGRSADNDDVAAAAASSRARMTERLLPNGAGGGDDKQLHWLREASVAPMAARASRANCKLTDPPVARGRLHLAAALVSLSSFMWGYGAAVLNVCIVPDAVGSLLVDLNLSIAEQETATALVVVGALVAALATGGVGDFLGHKRTILANNIFYIAGAVVCALATSKTVIFVGRFCIGCVGGSRRVGSEEVHADVMFGVYCSIGSGIVTNTVPILLNEISPPQIRGQITSYHQLSLTIGMLATGIFGYFLITEVPSGWRVRITEWGH